MVATIDDMIDATSYNRAYLASYLRHSAQIPLWGTSDTLVTLSEIGGVWLMKKIRKMWRPPLNTKR